MLPMITSCFSNDHFMIFLWWRHVSDGARDVMFLLMMTSYFFYDHILFCLWWRQGLSGVMDSTLAFHADDPGSIPGSGSKGVALCHSLEWRASIGWDVKPRSSLCSTPNMDYKDPDIHWGNEFVIAGAYRYLVQTPRLGATPVATE